MTQSQRAAKIARVMQYYQSAAVAAAAAPQPAPNSSVIFSDAYTKADALTPAQIYETVNDLAGNNATVKAILTKLKKARVRPSADELNIITNALLADFMNS